MEKDYIMEKRIHNMIYKCELGNIYAFQSGSYADIYLSNDLFWQKIEATHLDKFCWNISIVWYKFLGKNIQIV